MSLLHGWIDKYGEGVVRADLARLFHIDLDSVWSGRVTVRHVILLLGQAPAYEDSRIRAGLINPEMAGWDRQTDILANVHDLIASLIAGLSGKKLPDDSRYPRPRTKAEPVLFAATLADFAARSDKFMDRVMNGN